MLFKTHAVRVYGFITACALNGLFYQILFIQNNAHCENFLISVNLNNLCHTRNGIKFCSSLFLNQQPDTISTGNLALFCTCSQTDCHASTIIFFSIFLRFLFNLGSFVLHSPPLFSLMFIRNASMTLCILLPSHPSPTIPNCTSKQSIHRRRGISQDLHW